MKSQRTRSQERIIHLLKTLNRAVSAQELFVESKLYCIETAHREILVQMLRLSTPALPTPVPSYKD